METTEDLGALELPGLRSLDTVPGSAPPVTCSGTAGVGVFSAGARVGGLGELTGAKWQKTKTGWVTSRRPSFPVEYFFS